MRGAPYVPAGLIVYLVVTGLKARRVGRSLDFGPTAVVRWLLLALIVGFAGAAVYFSITPPPSLLGSVVSGFTARGGARSDLR
jgi:hypothetical protein